MIAKNLISKDISPLEINESGNSALNKMTEYGVHHLPVVQEGYYKGMIAEYEVMDMAKLDDSIEELEMKESRLSAHQLDHFFDVVKKMSTNSISLLPVIDEGGVYIGLITKKNIIKHLSEINAFKDPGGVIILEVNALDYSMADIARIVESNDAKILGAYLDIPDTSKKLTVTLKIDRVELDTILATFERFDYEIKASYREDGSEDYLQDRLASFLNYLNI